MVQKAERIPLSVISCHVKPKNPAHLFKKKTKQKTDSLSIGKVQKGYWLFKEELWCQFCATDSVVSSNIEYQISNCIVQEPEIYTPVYYSLGQGLSSRRSWSECGPDKIFHKYWIEKLLHAAEPINKAGKPSHVIYSHEQITKG